MPDSDFVDYYELLQISPNAEVETIHRVYKMLATRYHPDNTETGDLARFLLLNQAYETLADAGLRSSYNAVYEEHKIQPIGLFMGFALYTLEATLIAALQAFIFASLSAIYIGGAIHPDH